MLLDEGSGFRVALAPSYKKNHNKPKHFVMLQITDIMRGIGFLLKKGILNTSFIAFLLARCVTCACLLKIPCLHVSCCRWENAVYCTKKGRRNRSARGCVCFSSATNPDIRERKRAFGFELWLEYFKKHRELLISLFFCTSVRLGLNSQ